MPLLRDRSGAWCPEKVMAFAGAVIAALWLAYRVWSDDLGPRPVTEAIHFTGFWAVRFLWITLAITPASRIFHAPRLLRARRILGVTAFAYALFHLGLYALDQKFNLAVVASEIVLRFYLTIGFLALAGLAVLAATSTDGMVRRLGGHRWILLHRLCYPVAALAEVHFLLQAKNDVYEPILMLGLLAWLFGWRVMHHRWGWVAPQRLAVLGIGAAALTMLIETAWYRAMTGVNAWRVFMANFDFSYEIRPAWWVLAASLAVALAAWLWRLRPQRKPVARRSTPRASSGRAQVQSAN